MKHPTSSVPSAQKIEKIILDHFQSVGFDPIDTFSYQVEKRFDLIELKLNEIIDRLNADQPGSHQGGEDGKDKVKVVINRIPDWMDCNCKCHKFDDNTGMVCPHCHPEDYELRSEPSSPQDAKPLKKVLLDTDQNHPAIKAYIEAVKKGQAPLESGQAEWEQRFDDDFINCFYDVDGNYHKKSVRDFIRSTIKQELARQRSEIKQYIESHRLNGGGDDYDEVDGGQFLDFLAHLDQEDQS